jgi:hypothetical protein
MANENQNTGPGLNQPQGSTQTQKSAQELKDSLKEILKLQGDYRDIVKDSIKELQATLKNYDKMEAKLASINKSAINIKEVEAQIKTTTEKSFTNTKKLADLEKEISETQKNRGLDFNKAIEKQQKLQKELNENIALGYTDIARAKQNELNALESFIEREKEDIGLKALEYAQAKKTEELNQEILTRLEKQRIEEKRINDSIGVSGYLAKTFADKLGIGNKFYEKIVERSRDANKELTLSEKATILWGSAMDSLYEYVDKLKKDPAAIAAGIIGIYKAAQAGLTKLGDVARSAATGISDFMSMTGDQVISKLGKGVSDLVSKIPFVGGLLSGLVDGFTTILNLSLQEDDKITKIGRELGVSRTEAGKISEQFNRIANNSGKALISSRGLLESQKELSNELGVTNVLSGEILTTNIELGKLAGLDAKTRASIAQSSIITGQSSKAITESVLGQVGALKAATGISFNYQKILGEASSLGGVLGLQFAKYPEKLTKALVTTKSLGLELSKLDSMADSFLDFESSISKEFEAQLLTGKEINLAKAREAFLNNDLVTAAKEITSQVGSSSEFLNMNRIQQDAIAGAMGMSKNEMADMLKQQEMLAKLGAKDLKDAQAKVEAMKAEGKTREEIVKKIGEEAYINMTNASTQEKVAGFLDKIQSAVATFLSSSPIVGLIDKAMEFLSKPENITGIVVKIQSVFATLFDIMGSVAAGIMKLANFFGADIDENLIEQAKSGGDFIRNLDLTGPVTVSDNMARGSSTQNSGGQQTGGSNPNSMKKSQTEINQYFRVEMPGLQGQNYDQTIITQ